MDPENKINFKDFKITQLGFIFKDIKKQAKIWEELFDIPKFSFLPPHITKYYYKGKMNEVKVSLAFNRCFDTQLEFVQHIEGESYHTEFLEKGREGLHHISVFVEDIESYIEKFKKMGIDQISGGQRGRQVFAHFDTEDTLGFIIELQETKKKIRKK
jgi:hypothetical protein